MNITEFDREHINFDIAIIGGGPGGYVAAFRAAQLGLDTLLIEKDELGGTCLNRGCIPTKSFLASAKMLKSIKTASDFGIDVSDIKFDFSRIVERKDTVVQSLREGVFQLLKKRKVTTLFGKAVLKDAHNISVIDDSAEVTVHADKIILAAGSKSLCPGPLKPDGKRIITSTEALDEKELPSSIAIIGGGVIGCEFASIYASFGVNTTIIEGMPTILPREEKSTSAFLRTSFKKQGITIKAKSMVNSIEKTENGMRVILDKGDPVEAEKVLVAIGRASIEDDLGIRKLGIETNERGFVKVDEKMRTNIEHIYCIGDMTGQWLLAHSASYGGIIAAHNCAGQDISADFTVVPNCIFTLPEISSVGINEAEYKKQGIETVSGKFPFSASGKARAEGHDQGFVKVVAEKSSHRIIGCTVAGDSASNLIAEMALAIKKKLTLEDVAHTIHAHPSLPETVAESCEKALGFPIHTLAFTALLIGLTFVLNQL